MYSPQLWSEIYPQEQGGLSGENSERGMRSVECGVLIFRIPQSSFRIGGPSQKPKGTDGSPFLGVSARQGLADHLPSLFYETIKVNEVDEADDGQAEEHDPEVRQSENDPHEHRSDSHPQITHGRYEPHRRPPGDSREVKGIGHQAGHEKGG